MTCIVGYIYQDKVYIGGDSQGSSGYSITRRADPKVFINKNFIMGFTSSYRMGQILMSSKFNPDQQNECQTDFDYMITTFVDHIRTLFTDNGYIQIKDSREQGGIFLVGYKGALYKIDSDFQVGISVDSYDACGCGEEYALGAMYIMNETPLTVEEKIKKAIESAAYHNSGVGGEIKILSL